MGVAHLAPRYRNFPWIVLGDFSAIRSVKRQDRGMVDGLPRMRFLVSVLLSALLVTLNMLVASLLGPINRKFITSKIDRVLVYESWFGSFPQSSAFFFCLLGFLIISQPLCSLNLVLRMVLNLLDSLILG